MDKYDATEKAWKDNIPCHCIWCRKDCERTEVVDTGEAWERWCYCKDCDEESYHLIEEH